MSSSHSSSATRWPPTSKISLRTGAVNGTGNTSEQYRSSAMACDNKLDGGGGADTLRRQRQRSILGGRGFDYLVGGDGNDTLKGGADVGLSGGRQRQGRHVRRSGRGRVPLPHQTPATWPPSAATSSTASRVASTGSSCGSLLTEFGISAANAFSGGFVLLTKDGYEHAWCSSIRMAGLTAPITLATVANANVVAGDLMLSSQFIL